MPTVVVTARSRICVWAVPDHPGGPACRGRSCRGTTCPVGAVVVALVSRLGVLVTGTSAGRIVGRRTRVSCFRRATRPRVARPSGFDDGGRLLQSCCAVLFTECRRRADTFTLNKLECSKQAQIWRGGFTAVSSKGPEYWSHGIMEQDLGPAHLRPSRAREIALRGVSVRGPPGRGRQSPARPAGPVFGTGGNDQQRRAGAFVPRR
ncbi:hypothetical protein ACI65C_013061 [Semiaphis heraclei]